MKELLKKLVDNDIDFSQYILLYSLFHGDKRYAEEYNKVEIYDNSQSIQKLIHLGFIARVELLEGTSRYTDFFCLTVRIDLIYNHFSSIIAFVRLGSECS